MNRDVILNAAVDEQAPLICKTAEVIGSTRKRASRNGRQGIWNKFLPTWAMTWSSRRGYLAFTPIWTPAGRDRSCV